MADEQISTRIRRVIASWGNLKEVADFALLRHDFADCDSGCGVEYPRSPGELGYEPDKGRIAAGNVELSGDWEEGEGWTEQIPETQYVKELIAVLRENNLQAEAASLEPAAGERA